MWIFSDGSVSGTHKKRVGGGYIITKTDKSNNPAKVASNIIVENSLRLPYGSITMAELISMKEAFKYILETKNINPDSIMHSATIKRLFSQNPLTNTHLNFNKSLLNYD